MNNVTKISIGVSLTLIAAYLFFKSRSAFQLKSGAVATNPSGASYSDTGISGGVLSLPQAGVKTNPSTVLNSDTGSAVVTSTGEIVTQDPILSTANIANSNTGSNSNSSLPASSGGSGGSSGSIGTKQYQTTPDMNDTQDCMNSGGILIQSKLDGYWYCTPNKGLAAYNSCMANNGNWLQNKKGQYYCSQKPLASSGGVVYHNSAGSMGISQVRGSCPGGGLTDLMGYCLQ